MMQIDVDIFEPQGIRKLDVQTSFLPEELATQLIKKSYSGKEVCGMAWGGGRGGAALWGFSSWLFWRVQAGPGNQARTSGFHWGERDRCFPVGIPGELGTPGSQSNLAKAGMLRLGKAPTVAVWSGVSSWLS